MKASLLYVSAASLLALSNAMPTKQNYCAAIDAGGIKGYFGMALDAEQGQALYGWSLNLNGLLDKAEYDVNDSAEQPLSWHIHSYWNDNGYSSGYTEQCAAPQTGGRYDPGFACGQASQYQLGADPPCAKLSRNPSSGFVYPCTPKTFSQGSFGNCEVGDLSGKLGSIAIVGGKSVHDNNALLTDPMPVYSKNYQDDGLLTLPWASIVFHKKDGKHFFCAKLVLDTDESSSCSKAGIFAKAAPPITDDTPQYSKKELTKWIIVSVVLTIVVNVVMYVVYSIYDRLCGKGKEEKKGKGRQSEHGVQKSTMHNHHKGDDIHDFY